jgi:hypothetical protein
MREIAVSQAAAGLTPSLFEALAEVFIEISRTALARVPPEEAGSDLGETLRGLERR